MTEKTPFPPKEELEWVKIEKPTWAKNVSAFTVGALVFDICETYLDHRYDLYKEIYENSNDFVITWKIKEKNPNQVILEMFDEADRLGLYPVIQYDSGHRDENDKKIWLIKDLNTEFEEGIKYRLKVYKMNLNKLMASSYAENSFTNFEMKEESQEWFHATVEPLWGIHNEKFNGWAAEARLPQGVEPKGIWMDDVTKDFKEQYEG